MNMKNYLKQICSIALFVLFACPPNNVFASDRDPFSPTGGNGALVTTSITADAEEEENSENHAGNPLTSSKLNNYKIIGTIISKKVKVAMVKSLSGVDYTIKVGNRLGSEGSIVKDITNKGIKLDNKGKSIFLAVSNKIEVKIEE